MAYIVRARNEDNEPIYMVMIDSQGRAARTDTPQTPDAQAMSANHALYAFDLAAWSYAPDWFRQIPSNLAQGDWELQFRVKQGGSALITDPLFDTTLNGVSIPWTGSQIASLAAVGTQQQIAETVDSVLSTSHGAGLWTSGGSVAQPDVCNVEGYLFWGDGSPANGALIRAHLLTGGQAAGDGVGLTEYVKREAGVDGYFRIPLIRELSYNLYIPAGSIDATILVPDSDDVNFRTLLDA